MATGISDNDGNSIEGPLSSDMPTIHRIPRGPRGQKGPPGHTGPSGNPIPPSSSGSGTGAGLPKPIGPYFKEEIHTTDFPSFDSTSKTFDL
jgi:hypothetical protein